MKEVYRLKLSSTLWTKEQHPDFLYDILSKHWTHTLWLRAEADRVEQLSPENLAYWTKLYQQTPTEFFNRHQLPKKRFSFADKIWTLTDGSRLTIKKRTREIIWETETAFRSDDTLLFLAKVDELCLYEADFTGTRSRWINGVEETQDLKPVERQNRIVSKILNKV